MKKSIINTAQNILFVLGNGHKESHEKLLEISQDVKNSLKLFEQNIKHHQKEIDENKNQLKNGNKEFKKIREDISKLSTSYELLAQAQENRRNKFKKDDKK